MWYIHIFLVKILELIHLAKIFTNRTPFQRAQGQHPTTIVLRVKRGDRPDPHRNIPEWLGILLQGCWAEAPDSRPSAHEVARVMNRQ